MIKDFLRDGVVVKYDREDNDYVNTVFLRAKRDIGDGVKQYKMILNVKELKHHVQYIHFKMDSLESCLTLIEHNCFMASIGMEDAYHSSPIHPDYTEYLKFTVNEKLYKYFVLSQGYRDSPRIFTKLTKPIVSHLHEQGILCSLYIDDVYIQGSSFDECHQNVEYANSLLKRFGFDISSKSNVIPSQKIKFDSRAMTVSLGPDKKKNIREILLHILYTDRSIPVIRLAQVIGTLVECFLATQYGQLFYRSLESLKLLLWEKHMILLAKRLYLVRQ